MGFQNRFKRILFFNFIFGASTAFAGEPVVKHYLQQASGATPRILTINNKLVILGNANRLLQIFNLDTDQLSYSQAISALPTTLTSDGKLLGFCDSIGTQINILDLDQPQKIQKISLLPPAIEENIDQNKEPPIDDGYRPSKRLYQLNCSALSFEPNNFLWMSSPGSQEIVKINYRFKKIRKIHRVSGPFYMKKFGPNIFTVNDIAVMSDAAVPYILNEEGKSLVGAAMGEGNGTQLTRGYAPLVFVDEPSMQVYYAKPRERVLHSFSAIAPNEKEMKEIPVSVGRTRSLARYNQCILVGGQNDEDESAMEFSLIRMKGFGAEEIWKSSILKLEGMAGFREMQISANHKIIVSDWLGVHAIEGLFSPELCD